MTTVRPIPLANRESYFLLLITGDGNRGFMALLNRPSVVRVKQGLEMFSSFCDNKGKRIGSSVFVTVLERWLNPHSTIDRNNPVQTKDSWSHANWDGSFFDENGEKCGPESIDPRLYVSAKELRDHWIPVSFDQFKSGSVFNTENAFEVCIQEDCL